MGRRVASGKRSRRLTDDRHRCSVRPAGSTIFRSGPVLVVLTCRCGACCVSGGWTQPGAAIGRRRRALPRTSASRRPRYAGAVTEDHHELPTPRTALAGSYVRVLVFCRSCRHQRDADRAALVDAGRGDVPLIHLRFRCSQCGTGNTGFVVMSRDNPQPW
jgi:hypothetical protein